MLEVNISPSPGNWGLCKRNTDTKRLNEVFIWKIIKQSNYQDNWAIAKKWQKL